MPDGNAHAPPAAPDTAAAASFLRAWVAEWPSGWHLVLCELIEGGGMLARSWPADEVAGGRAERDISRWLLTANGTARRNCYFTPNPVSQPMATKPTKADIAAVVCLHADIDPPKGVPYAQGRRIIEDGFAALMARSNAGLHLIDSGHGANILLKLSTALPADRTAEAEEASRRLATKCAEIFHTVADATQNVDRLLRLPGSVNWPTAAKRKKGYPDEARPSRLLLAKPGGTAMPRLAPTTATAGSRAPSPARAAPTIPAAAAVTEAQRIGELEARLLAQWDEITAGLAPSDQAWLDSRLSTAPGLRRRWQGNTEGLADSSASGLTMALAGCLVAAHCDPLMAARLLHACPHSDIATPKHPTPQAQARAIARAWVRSAANPREDAEAEERIAAAAREATERALKAALPDRPDLVAELLPLCTADEDDAGANASYAKAREGLAGRAGLGVRDLNRLRHDARAAGARARAAAVRREAAGSRVRIDTAESLDRQVDAAERALADPASGVFVFGGLPVEVSDRAAEGCMVVPLTAATMALALSRVALFQSGPRSIDPPHAVARALADRRARSRLRPIAAISAAPMLLPDGRVVLKPGYDAEAKLFLAADWGALDLPSQPSREDAQAALAAMLSPFRQFPFADLSGPSALAAHILHMLARHLLPTVPALIFSAPTPGSGKTLLGTASSLIVHGRDPAIMPALAGRDASEETRKRITSLLREARADVLFDNLPRGAAVGDAVLDSLLTSAAWSDRILGGNTTAELPNTAVLAFTGNNIRTRGDTARRVLWAYIAPAEAQPETRRFEIADLRGHLRRERPRLLAAALTVLRAHMAHNRPLAGGCAEAPLLGSFEEWSRLIAAGIEWAGGVSPIKAQEWGRERFDAGAEDAGGLDALLQAMHVLFGAKPQTAAALLAASGDPLGVWEGAQSANPARALSDAIAAVLEGQQRQDARALGRSLSAHTDRPTAGGWVLRAGPPDRVTKVRTFYAARSGANAPG